MSERYDYSDPGQAALGTIAAEEAIRRGELVVLPTDTTYGVGVDAFTPWAVERLRAARGVSSRSPMSVLVGTVRAAAALVDDLGPFGQDLIDEFWPGGLTLVARATPTLAWDLGDTRGTVAVRMPLHAVALDLLKATGPMAVSSANTTGRLAATTADEAMEQLGDSVSVYLDGGPCGGGVASTIIDLTGSVPRLLRAGAISMDRLREVAALITGEEVSPPEATPGTEDSAATRLDGPPDIPSDSPADARADALAASAAPALPHPPQDAVDASSPSDPVDTSLQNDPGGAEVSASTPEAWELPGTAADDEIAVPADAPPGAPAEGLVSDSAQAQRAADDPAAPVTSESATAQKPVRARKPAGPRKPAARKPAAERKTTPRRPAVRKTTPADPPAPGGQTDTVSQPGEAEPGGPA